MPITGLINKSVQLSAFYNSDLVENPSMWNVTKEEKFLASNF